MHAARQVHPEALENYGDLLIMPDDYSVWGIAVNLTLDLADSMKRALVIVTEADNIPASGVWTREQAHKAADRLTRGPDGNFFDPLERRGMLRPFQYLGLIE